MYGMQEVDHTILDRASEALGCLRNERADNLAQLRQSANEWAQNLHAKGVSERAQVCLYAKCRKALNVTCLGGASSHWLYAGEKPITG